MKKKILLFLILLFVSLGGEARDIDGRPGQYAYAKGEKHKVSEKISEWEVVKKFNREIPASISKDIKYEGELPEYLSYVVVLSNRINVREKPTTKSEILSKAVYGTRLQVLEEVENKEGEGWYKVLRDGSEVFVYKKIVALREFRFEKSYERLERLEIFIRENISEGREIASVNSYLPNPDNKDLMRDKDKYGNVEDQSAKGDYNGTEVFVADRTIVAIQEQIEGKYRVEKIGGDEPFLDIATNRISKNPEIAEMPKKAIVIDIKNQNFIVYEKEEESWNVISYALSKTGAESKLGFRTPRGEFIVPMAKRVMIYNDSEGEKQGYANYAIRFSGGGYIHGTPFNLEEEEELERHRQLKESTLGSYPGTRKCVRNDVIHARFLFEWVVGDIEKSKNHQKVEENVVVIVM